MSTGSGPPDDEKKKLQYEVRQCAEKRETERINLLSIPQLGCLGQCSRGYSSNSRSRLAIRGKPRCAGPARVAHSSPITPASARRSKGGHQKVVLADPKKSGKPSKAFSLLGFLSFAVRYVPR